MKAFLIIGAAAALVYGQADSTGYFRGEPSCALPCLSSAITEAGCQLSDIACQCGPTQSVIADKAGGCLTKSCTDPTDLGAAINAGQAVCSSFLAGALSFTAPGPGGPVQTPTPVPGSSSAAGTTGTSIVLTDPPMPSTTSIGSSGGTLTDSGFMSITSDITNTGVTHTDTLIGPSSLTGPPSSTGATHTDTLIGTSSLTSLPLSSPSPTGAAATQGRLGAGVLAGIVGAVAFL